MTPFLAHSTPFRSRRSLAKVSTNAGEAHHSPPSLRRAPSLRPEMPGRVAASAIQSLTAGRKSNALAVVTCNLAAGCCKRASPAGEAACDGSGALATERGQAAEAEQAGDEQSQRHRFGDADESERERRSVTDGRVGLGVVRACRLARLARLAFREIY